MSKTMTITKDAWIALNQAKAELRAIKGEPVTYSDVIIWMWNNPKLQQAIEESENKTLTKLVKE
ncbi:MAG: hypothetical protein ACFFCW_13615 [Candidatus Hodarchaeota archaeon]